MRNIIDYIRDEFKTFEEKPLNQVDSLIFSNFSYINLDDFVPNGVDNNDEIEIMDILKRENFKKMFKGTTLPDSFEKFVYELSASPRFRNVKIKHFVNINDKKVEKQFAAITFILNKEYSYIAFRGTDDSFNGWKEDFNMAFKCPVPSQEEALQYVEAVYNKLTPKIYLGGHSKGGNLAVYTLIKANKSLQDKIEYVFSHDGPGFRKEVIESEEFKKIKPKIKKTLPQSSIIGMLLQTQENYKIVNSDAFFIMQHEPFSWQVKNSDFDYTENLSGGARYTNLTINKWINSMNDAKREKFVNQMFKALYATNETTFTSLAENWRKNLPIIMGELRNLDEETKEIMYSIIRELGKFWFSNYGSNEII